jgi:nucleoside-diphosphate-sugar epimerase
MPQEPMIVLVAGADGRLGRLLVASLIDHGHMVRGLVRTHEQAAALGAVGATPLLADLRGDIEWAAVGCDAAVFAAGARRRSDLGAIDAGGAAKLAEAAAHFDLRRFVLCSALGSDAPERWRAPLRDFLTTKRYAERRLKRLRVPWTILRFGRLTDGSRRGRITTAVDGRRSLTISRHDAATTVVEALAREHLARRVLDVVEGDRHIGDALDAVQPAPPPRVRSSGLAAVQALNPRPDPDALFPDAGPLDAAVDYEGEGALPPEVIGNDDPAPGMP